MSDILDINELQYGQLCTISAESRQSGYTHDHMIVNQLLENGKIYEIEDWDIGDSSTKIYLKGIHPGINSVQLLQLTPEQLNEWQRLKKEENPDHKIHLARCDLYQKTDLLLKSLNALKSLGEFMPSAELFIAGSLAQRMYLQDSPSFPINDVDVIVKSPRIMTSIGYKTILETIFDDVVENEFTEEYIIEGQYKLFKCTYQETSFDVMFIDTVDIHSVMGSTLSKILYRVIYNLPLDECYSIHLHQMDINSLNQGRCSINLNRNTPEQITKIKNRCKLLGMIWYEFKPNH